MTPLRYLFISLIGLLPITTAFGLTFPATPSWEVDGGAISQYLRNAVGNPCPPNSFVTGFSTGSVGVYMTPDCTSILSGITIPASWITGGYEWYITRFSTGGEGIVSSRIFESGTYIGIGTIDPRSTLEINGQILITGWSPGLGKILTSDANGLATWEPSSAALSVTLWSILWNTGTTAGTNFIGTNDATDIVFKTNASEKLRIRDSDGDLRVGTMTIWKGAGSILSNTAIGVSALGSNTAGTDNSAFWLWSLFSNNTGNRNTGIGEWALNANQNWNDNTIIGYNAWGNLISGNRNIAIWVSATFPSITGSDQLNIGNWIYGSGGNIGIWVTVPTSKFSVNGGVSITGGYLDYAPGGIHCTNGQILVWNTATSIWQCSSEAPGIAGGGSRNSIARWVASGSTTTLTGSDMLFHTGTRIGINTTTPQYMLDVLWSGSYVNVGSGYCLNNSCINSWSGLIGYVRSTGSPDYLAKFDSSWVLSNSQLFETGGKIYIGDISSILWGGVAGVGFITIESPASTNSSRPFITMSELWGQECRMWINGANKIGSNCEWTAGVTGYNFLANQVIKADSSGTSLTGASIYESSGNVWIGVSSPGSKLDVGGTFKLGTNGSSLSEIIKTTASITIPTIAANTTTQVNVTVTNASTSWVVSVSPSGLLTSGLVIAYARVSAANTVTIAYRNTTSGSISSATLNHYITVIQ